MAYIKIWRNKHWDFREDVESCGDCSVAFKVSLSYLLRRSQLVAYRPIVVLSAMSTKKKSEGTTSRLLAAVVEVLNGNSKRYLEIVNDIERHHVEACMSAISDAKIRRTAVESINLECHRLRNFLAAAEVSKTLFNDVTPFRLLRKYRRGLMT